MRRILNRMRILRAFALLAMLTLLACEHKDLNFEYAMTARVRVVFDWKNALEAAPATMSLYLFPQDGGKPQTYEFTDYRGDYIEVPFGQYKAVCVNSDTESVLYRNIDFFDRFEAYAQGGVMTLRSAALPRTKGTANERVTQSPDPLYTARLDEVVINSAEENQVVTLYPELSVARVRVTIRNVDNLKYLSADAITGALTGLSGGLLVGLNRTTTDPVTVPFKVESDGESTLTAEFLAFGQPGTSRQVNKLVVYAIIPDGSKNSYTFDVTQQLKSASDPYNVHIVLDGLPLPKPIVSGGSGFQPDVDDWEHVDVDVAM